MEQCQNCSGIFLDRGELEQIVAAEKRHYGSAPPPYAPGGGPVPHGGHAHQGRADSPRGYRGSRDSPRPYGGGHRDSPRPYGGGSGYSDSPGPYGRRRKKSFLENLFD